MQGGKRYRAEARRDDRVSLSQQVIIDKTTSSNTISSSCPFMDAPFVIIIGSSDRNPAVICHHTQSLQPEPIDSHIYLLNPSISSHSFLPMKYRAVIAVNVAKSIDQRSVRYTGRLYSANSSSTDVFSE